MSPKHGSTIERSDDRFDVLVPLQAKIAFIRDESGAERAATTWSKTLHLLCIFHLWKNFYKHIKPLFVSEQEKWREAAYMWWLIAKENDSPRLDRCLCGSIATASRSPWAINPEIGSIAGCCSRGSTARSRW